MPEVRSGLSTSVTAGEPSPPTPSPATAGEEAHPGRGSPAFDHQQAEPNLPGIVVLASGSGTNLQALLDATRVGTLACRVSAVVSDRPEAVALRRAEAASIPAVAMPLAGRHDPRTRQTYDRLLAEAVAAYAPDLVVLAGWMLVLSPAFLNRFPERVVNVHPALLPDAAQATVSTSAGPQPAVRGARAVREALRLGLPVSGATVHWVTPRVDEGWAILREEVPILAGDDEATLHARIKSVEHRLLPRAVALALDRVGVASERASVAADRVTGRPCAAEKGTENVAGGDRSWLEVGPGAR